jgi:hypothetical protein
VRNEEELRRVKGGRNVLRAVKRRKANCIGHILRRNCLLKHAIERKIWGKRRRGITRRQLLYDLKEKRGYCKLKEEALNHTLWRTGLGRSYGPVVKQTTEYETHFVNLLLSLAVLYELCLQVREVSGHREVQVSYSFCTWVRIQSELGCVPEISSTPPLTEMSTRNTSWGWRWPMSSAYNLTTFTRRLSWNLGASTSWNPQGLSRLVMGLLFNFCLKIRLFME